MQTDLRIAGSTQGRRSFKFLFDGREVTSFEGEAVGTALLAAGIPFSAHQRGHDSPHGLFCAMGLCQECVVRVDGVLTEACRLLAREGLVVSSSE